MSIDDFRDEEGNVDWKAYEQHEISIGNRCYKCREYIVNLGKHQFQQLCYSCRGLREGAGETEHQRIVRCPHCRHETSGQDLCEMGLYQAGLDGEGLDVFCFQCDEEFHVSVRVEWYFTSPPLITNATEAESEID